MTALEYHEATKHHFNRFARSAGYLDWATQPIPSAATGAPLLPLPEPRSAADVPYSASVRPSAPPRDSRPSVAEFLRCSLGLSAWKQYRSFRGRCA
jgi:hypothetical protein